MSGMKEKYVRYIEDMPGKSRVLLCEIKDDVFLLESHMNSSEGFGRKGILVTKEALFKIGDIIDELRSVENEKEKR